MERSIEAATTLRASIHQVREALLFHPACLVDGEGSTAEELDGELRATLSVATGGGPSVQQEVAVELGSVQPGGDVLSLSLSWKAIAWQRLFPSFSGKLEASPHGSGTRLRLHGIYEVPLGPLGRFADGGTDHRGLRPGR